MHGEFPDGAVGDSRPADISRYGDLLRTLRHRAALSQDELAEIATVSRGTIQNLECYRVVMPRHDTHELIKRVLAEVVGEKEVAALDDAYRAVRRQRLTKQAEWRQKWTA